MKSRKYTCVYIGGESGFWFVGFWEDKVWVSESECGSREEAVARAASLNRQPVKATA